MINITYLIPLDSIGGGVEVAAKGVRKISNDYFKFNVEYLSFDNFMKTKGLSAATSSGREEKYWGKIATRGIPIPGIINGYLHVGSSQC